MGEQRFLDDCARLQGSHNLGFGYAPLIRAYVDYLKAKIEFHRVHPEFTGNFDYEEYQSLKGIADLNEGYQTIMELIDLQAKLEQFEKIVFDNFRSTSHNECRIASLVPLIEESHGIYMFLTSMLSAMHLSIESPDPLVPLVERYNQLFWDLKRFYQESNRIQYLTSLIAIPELPDQPPSFTDIMVSKPIAIRKEEKPLPAPPKSPSISSVSASSVDLLGDSLLEKEQTPIQQLKGLQYGTYTNTVQTVAIPVIDTNMQLMVQQLQAENAELRAQLENAAKHIAGLEEIIKQDQEIKSELQRQLDMKELRHEEQLRALESHLKSVRNESDTWKARSEAMSKLYQGLRDEHLQLLTQPDEELERKRKLEEEERKRREMEEEEERKRRREEEQRQKEEEEKRRRQAEEETQNPFEDPSSELERLVETVEDAANKFNSVAQDISSHIAFPKNLHEAILGETNLMTGLLGNLIRAAIAAQKEIMAEGKGGGLTPAEFYLKNSSWTEGLVSAAKAVASDTVLLVESANGALLGSHTLEQLVVASGKVTASTAQLVTASRVKAVRRSKAQPELEDAAKSVKECNKRLVNAVSTSAIEEAKPELPETIEGLSSFTVIEMNKKAELQAVEKKLDDARQHLAKARRDKYHTSEDQEEDLYDLEQMNIQVEIKELERKLALLRLEYDMLQLKRPEGNDRSFPDSTGVANNASANDSHEQHQLLM